MRPRPGGECNEIVERRWRDDVELLRGFSDGLCIEADIVSAMWPRDQL